jgi:hypothetical protein
LSENKQFKEDSSEAEPRDEGNICYYLLSVVPVDILGSALLSQL